MGQDLRYSIYALLFWVGITMLACANPIPPKGGPDDTTPPKIVQEESTPNEQTNFDKKSFELTFDEWIKLEDVFNQVVVSPPLEHKPKVTLKKRTVRFEFDEEETLRDDATYIVNFGKAVKDLNKSNVAENLRFVFSTGDYIDSLSVSGKIVDAFTGEPVSDILFMLYDNLADSVVSKELPFYFARTSKEGTFRIDNVKSDTFKVFALKDNNFNYLFDLDNEIIGFSDENIIVTDSTSSSVQLAVFESAKPLRILDKELNVYGHVKLVFNQSELDVDVTFEDVGQKGKLQLEKDTVHLWYDLTDSLAWNIYVNADTILNDTLKIKALSRSNFLSKAKLNIAAGTAVKKISQNPYESMDLTFSRPLSDWDTSVIILLEDTLETRVYPNVTIDEKDKRNLNISYNWIEEKPYTLQLLPGAVTDMYGLQNDTIDLNTRVLRKDEFGILNLTVRNMNPDINYIVHLMQGKKELSIDHFQSDSIYVHSYGAMQPGKYSVQIIEDVNKNRRWDPGDYKLKKQSERLFFREFQEELRAGWDRELEISVGQ